MWGFYKLSQAVSSKSAFEKTLREGGVFCNVLIAYAALKLLELS